VPIYCFNEHNEAFYYWHKFRIENDCHLALDLVHVDAHEDMARPSSFSESLYPADQHQALMLEYYYQFATRQLRIGNFIYPAVLSGAIKNVHFVYPKWRDFKPLRRFFSVSSAFGEGKIIKYGLPFRKNGNPLLKKSFPDLKRFMFQCGEAKHLPHNRTVILDIDLDYFACCDSISNNVSLELEISSSQYANRELFLQNKSLPFSGLQFTFSKRGDQCYAQIELRKIPDAGHRPSDHEIEEEIDSLIATLIRKKIKPAAITICRSCDSGYCPSSAGQFIEPLLTQKLQASFS